MPPNLQVSMTLPRTTLSAPVPLQKQIQGKIGLDNRCQLLMTSVRVVCRGCLPVCGGDLPHVARRIDAFLGSMPSNCPPTTVYERTGSLHCLQLVVARELSGVDNALTCDWVFNDVGALAAARGDLKTLMWLAESFRPNASLTTVMVSAAENDQLQVLEWLNGSHRDKVQWGGVELIRALRRGHTQVAQWLRLHAPPKPETASCVMLEAAKSGDLETLQWLRRHREYIVSVEATLSVAQYAHQWDVVQWLLTHYKLAKPCVYFDLAVQQADLPFLKWVHINGFGSPTPRTISSAAGCGRLDVIQWLYDGLRERRTSGDPMAKAARGGHLAVVQWLHAHNCNTTTAAMDLAATSGELQLVQWLHSNRKEGCSHRAMDGAAANGHFDVVKWLHSNRDEGCSSIAMDKAAENGYLEVLTWLHKHRSEGCTAEAMDLAASAGRLDIVMWLSTNRTEGCTTRAMDLAAASGHLNVATWLHNNRTEGCTIEAMTSAAARGHLDVVRWLHANRSEGCSARSMEFAAENGQLEVVQWLHANQKENCASGTMRGALRSGQFMVLLFLIRVSGRQLCETALHDLRQSCEQVTPRLEMAQWLLSSFGDHMDGVMMRIDAADWGFNRWMQQHGCTLTSQELGYAFWTKSVTVQGDVHSALLE